MLETFENIEQGSPEWFEIRRGLPTASNFQCLVARSDTKAGRTTYLNTLAAEIVTGAVGESWTRPELERGKQMEGTAREAYCILTDETPKLVGFCRDMELGAGCSPDALLGEDGLLEIKTQRADLLVATILKGEFPSVHYAQVQGSLLVTGRQWADLVVYWPRLPLFVKRTKRDEEYIDALRAEIAKFRADLAETVKRVKAYGGLSG